ncbi:MAG: hypothetical protein P8Z42_08675 [Anaerolineales bacterium]|jgi:hypothetical protein
MSGQTETELVVAVSGHRELADRESVIVALEEAISAIEQAFPRQTYRLLSPLAEGADRLAAAVVLLRPLWKLWAILPLPVEDYQRSFSSTASRSEFDVLLKKTQKTLLLRPPVDRIEAYRKLGIYLVDHCHVLLAVWDGLPARGPGGTAEIVGFARKRGLPLALIRLNGGLPETDGPIFERFPPQMHTPQEGPNIDGNDR